ncbi:MAG: hypothetical protein LDL33_12590, partial [Desulfomonile sp.]|nr:hypothetical protein [Desulfomonile sp.]
VMPAEAGIQRLAAGSKPNPGDDAAWSTGTEAGRYQFREGDLHNRRLFPVTLKRPSHFNQIAFSNTDSPR